MALTAASMRTKIKAHINTISMATGIPNAAAHQDIVLLAFCQGIIDEILANAIVTTSDSNGDSGSGTIS